MKRLLAKAGRQEAFVTPFQPPSDRQQAGVSEGYSGDEAYEAWDAPSRSSAHDRPGDVHPSMYSDGYETYNAADQQPPAARQQPPKGVASAYPSYGDDEHEQYPAGGTGHPLPPRHGAVRGGQESLTATRDMSKKKENAFSKFTRRREVDHPAYNEYADEDFQPREPAAHRGARPISSHLPDDFEQLGSRENPVHDGRFQREQLSDGYAQSAHEPLHLPYPTHSPEVLRDPTEFHKTGKRGIWAGFGDRVRASKEASSNLAPPMMERDHSSHSGGSGPHYSASRPESRSKESKPNWLDLKGRGQAAKNAEGQIAAKIGWLCGPQASPSDWSNAHALADQVGQSEACAAEAIRSLRNELKAGDAADQKRAVKLWALLMVYSSPQFRVLAAKKKFLEVLEHTMTDSKVSLSVKEMLLDTWAMLANHTQYDGDLNNITKSYNKIRPRDRAVNGDTFDPHHSVFMLPSVMDAASTQRLSQSAPVLEVDPSLLLYNAERSKSASVEGLLEQLEQQQEDPNARLPAENRDFTQGMVTEDDFQHMVRECDIARSHASLLIDATTDQDPRSVEVAEFALRVNQSQEILSSQIEWISRQAEDSRRRLKKRASTTFQRDGHNRTSSGATFLQTREESLLANILDANEQLSASLTILQDAQQAADDDEEEARIKELSKTDYRVDRALLRQDANTGEFYSVDHAGRGTGRGSGGLSAPSMEASGSGSGSRTHSPRMPPRPLESARQAYHQEPSYAFSETAQHTSSRQEGGFRPGQLIRAPVQQPPPAAPRTPPPAPSRSAANSGAAPNSAATQTSYGSHSPTSSIIVTPNQPSEKALGKRRAISIDVSNSLGPGPNGEMPASSDALGRLSQRTDHLSLDTADGQTEGTRGPTGPTHGGSADRDDHRRSLENPHIGGGGGSENQALPPRTGQPPPLPPVPVGYREQQQPDGPVASRHTAGTRAEYDGQTHHRDTSIPPQLRPHNTLDQGRYMPSAGQATSPQPPPTSHHHPLPRPPL